MKLYVLIYFTLNGIAAQPYIMPAPGYVDSQAECTEYIEKVAEDYERTQPGWKFERGACRYANE